MLARRTEASWRSGFARAGQSPPIRRLPRAACLSVNILPACWTRWGTTGPVGSLTLMCSGLPRDRDVEPHHRRDACGLRAAGVHELGRADRPSRGARGEPASFGLERKQRGFGEEPGPFRLGGANEGRGRGGRIDLALGGAELGRRDPFREIGRDRANRTAFQQLDVEPVGALARHLGLEKAHLVIAFGDHQPAGRAELDVAFELVRERTPGGGRRRRTAPACSRRPRTWRGRSRGPCLTASGRAGCRRSCPRPGR